MSTAQTPRLLSVEDNPDTRLLLKHMLDEDYAVTFVSNVEEALEALSSEKSFDALLVDINLGSEKSGTDLLRHVDAQGDSEKLPAVAVTAYAMPGDREDLLAEGFDAYVGKPFTRADLQSAIGQVLS